MVLIPPPDPVHPLSLNITGGNTPLFIIAEVPPHPIKYVLEAGYVTVNFTFPVVPALPESPLAQLKTIPLSYKYFHPHTVLLISLTYVGARRSK